MAPSFSASPLILASTSRYRAGLLARLRIPFEQQDPGIDEQEVPGEAPQDRALRLSLEKARAVALRYPDRWVIGSDQVASGPDGILHKPGTPEINIRQLLSLSGQEARFSTGIALVRDEQAFTALDTTLARFRSLSAAEVERYVSLEPAHDCAGGFKIEGLGISLFEAVHSSDPTALVGLPLIALHRLLRNTHGWPVFPSGE